MFVETEYRDRKQSPEVRESFVFPSTLLAVSHVAFGFRRSMLQRSLDEVLILVWAGAYLVRPQPACAGSMTGPF